MASMIDAYGRDVADRLAALAVDMALDPQAAASPIKTYQTRVRSTQVEEVRDVLTKAGFDARAYHRDAVRRDLERRRAAR